MTIAGSDSSGGAGIQADIRPSRRINVRHERHHCLDRANTIGVYGVEEASPDFVGQQLDCIFQDIFPDAVKIGMVSNIQIIQVIAEKLHEYGAQNIVVDPVMAGDQRQRAPKRGRKSGVDCLSVPARDNHYAQSTGGGGFKRHQHRNGR